MPTSRSEDISCVAAADSPGDDTDILVPGMFDTHPVKNAVAEAPNGSSINRCALQAVSKPIARH